MIKIVEIEKDGKIHLTKEELEEFLEESYCEGIKSKDYHITYVPYPCYPNYPKKNWGDWGVTWDTKPKCDNTSSDTKGILKNVTYTSSTKDR